jgi:UDP-glucose 4-epimerase
MDILVIGGAGYIGSHTARELLDRGHRVTVFDNLSSGVRENLFPDAAFVHGDILDYEALRRAAQGADCFVHLAAFKAVGESMEKPEKYSRNNIAGSVNILNAASECRVKYIIFSSSAAVFGQPEYLPVDEAHPVRPESYYGFTKAAIERFLDWYDRLKGIRYGCLRYFNAAGYDTAGRIAGLERNPANLIPVVMEAARGLRGEVQVFGDDYDTADGTGVRDYVHVSDLAAAHALALDYISANDASVTVNLGSETGLSVWEIINAARRVTGRDIPARVVGRRPGDCAALTASSQLARELLGWKPRFSGLDTLIESTWKAYQAAGAKESG